MRDAERECVREKEQGEVEGEGGKKEIEKAREKIKRESWIMREEESVRERERERERGKREGEGERG